MALLNTRAEGSGRTPPVAVGGRGAAPAQHRRGQFANGARAV